MIRKEIRRIKFTGKNLNDVFALPCVEKIMKCGNRPKLIMDRNMVSNVFNVALVGDDLVEYSDGKWEIQYGGRDE